MANFRLLVRMPHEIICRDTGLYYKDFFYYLLMFMYYKCKSWASQRNLFWPLAFSWTTARRTCNWRLCSLMSTDSRYKANLASFIFLRCACNYGICFFFSVFTPLLLQGWWFDPNTALLQPSRGLGRPHAHYSRWRREAHAYGKLRVERMNRHQLGAWMKKATRVEKVEKKWWDVYDS